jgi:glycosyltransferase involved in cell wall biosynthesis
VKVIKIIEEGRIGGPQMDILRVTPYVQKMGVSITVVLPSKNSNSFQQRLTEAGVPYKTTPLTTMRKHPKELLSYVLKFIPELFYLVFLIRNLKTDIVHVSGGSWQIKGVIAGRLAGRKVIWHLNDTQTPKVLKLLFRSVQPLAHAFITAGYRVQEYYLPNKIKRLIFNISSPVDCSVFDPALVQKTSSDDVRRVIIVANINPIKGLEMFIEAAILLNQKLDIPLEFRVVGPIFDSQKKYYEKLKDLVRGFKLNNFIFVGGVDDTRIELANSDVVVCCSLAEASPTVVWEALSMGKPIVSTNVGEVDYIIENGTSGIVCKNRDAQELATNIEYLLLHKEVTEKIRKKARTRAKNMLDVTLIAKQHFQAYRKTMEHLTKRI